MLIHIGVTKITSRLSIWSVTNHT